VELLGDYLGYPWTGPEVGTITRFQRSGQEDLQQLAFLFPTQTGLSPWMRFGFQSLQTAVFHGPLPSSHGTSGSAHDFGYLADFPAFRQ
jgi:hypothetical protein